MDQEISEINEIADLVLNLSFLTFIKTVHSRGTVILRLDDTNYILVFNIINGNVSWRKTYGVNGISSIVVSFEELFYDVPTFVQENLVFHLDIFKE